MAEPASIDISKHCLAVRLRRMNRVITAIYDDAIRPLGAKVSQLNILVVADRRGETTPTDVGRILHLEASTLSRNLKRMRRRDWIESVPSAGDARLQPFRLTDSGRRLLSEAHPMWKDAQEKASALLGEETVKAIMSSPAATLGKG